MYVIEFFVFYFEISMSVQVVSTTVTILVSVPTMLDPSHATVREDIQGTECGVQVKLFSLLCSNFPFP